MTKNNSHFNVIIISDLNLKKYNNGNIHLILSNNYAYMEINKNGFFGKIIKFIWIHLILSFFFNGNYK